MVRLRINYYKTMVYVTGWNPPLGTIFFSENIECRDCRWILDLGPLNMPVRLRNRIMNFRSARSPRPATPPEAAAAVRLQASSD